VTNNSRGSPYETGCCATIGVGSRPGLALSSTGGTAGQRASGSPAAGQVQRGGSGLGDVDVVPSSTYMIRSSLAVEEVSRRLSEGERDRLRATGEVPDWFLPEVTAVARHII